MSVMKYFEAISEIPRASFKEERISNYLKEFAIERGLKYIQDDMFNIIIFKPASEGYEKAPTVMLQGHIDMVAEKNNDSDHDFDHDPIKLIEKDGMLWADKTTLGADNGVAVAYMMALLDDEKAQHPALECVFTVQEETGLTGAAFLDTSILEASLCVGLDSSGDDETCVSTSGGVRVALEKELNFESNTQEAVHVSIKGLKGGHSGGDIDKERANASKLAGIILRRTLDEFPQMRLAQIDGGLKMNAITRENDFVIAIDDKTAFEAFLEPIITEMKVQYEFSDEGLEINTTSVKVDQVLTKEDTAMITDLLFMLPYGVIQKSMAIEDLVITSANIGTINILDNKVVITLSLRATQAYVLDNLMRQVQWLADLYQMEIEFSSNYPGWNFDAHSPFRKRLLEVYEAINGKTMRETATHGGMELGIWKDKMPELDIISFGPNMYEIHTPNEHLDIASFEKTYTLLENLLKSLNNF